MAGKRPFGNPVPVSDLAAAILDPVLRKRAGLSIGLVQSWEEIVGPRIAAKSRPERLQWPRRMGEDDPFRPATLIVACEGLAALHLQHESGEVIGRVNSFLGFEAVDRIRIVQKPVLAMEKPARRVPRALSFAEKAEIAARVQPIEDEGLRGALEKLGASVRGSRRR
ncbi:DciA family protein [Mesorhizobium sp. LHD-90]|uniref:DUF721 domain-containing protein n=1 Tax=Mesorhizobium sp. LHD-90 TaxID=3071414 RepID=UPI0027E06F49|nr:DciA family protein [Mesorhizobium sp. LHD-90]MDQ6435947.1 DciA family protein [Mesorhizobium sp. LHD-90]